MRYAIIIADTHSFDTICRYLPSNYSADFLPNGNVIIFGNDSAGWTLDNYVIPRLASGMIFAKEVFTTDEIVETYKEWEAK